MSDSPGPRRPEFHETDRAPASDTPTHGLSALDPSALSYAPLARPAEDTRYPRIAMSRGSAVVDLFLVVALMLLTYETVILLEIPRRIAEFSPVLGFLWTNVMLGVVSLAIVAVVLLGRRQSAAVVGLTRFSVGKTIGLALATVPACYAAHMTTVTIFLKLTGQSFEDLIVERAEFFKDLPTVPPLIAVAFSLFVGVHEEILFRGFILGRLRALLRSTPAGVVVSSVVFGLLHGYQGMIGVVQTTTVGLILAIVAAHFRTIWPVIIAHGLFDAISLVVIPLVSEEIQEFARQLTTTQASP